MRHTVRTKSLNRDTNHRKALIRNLLVALFTEETITTTAVKAKFISSLAEKMVVQARKEGQSVSKKLMSELNNRDVVRKLTTDIAHRFPQQTGGFISMVRVYRRRGDNTVMTRVSLRKPLHDGDSETKSEASKATRNKIATKKVKSKTTKSKKEDLKKTKNSKPVTSNTKKKVAK